MTSIPTQPAKGQTIPLHVSDEGKKRIQVGIGWDIREKIVQKGFIIKTHETVHETYDLDLFCLIFDTNKDFLEIVSPDSSEMTDSSGSIFHSGDNETGRGENDDEFISINTADVPAHINDIVFVVMSNNQFALGEVLNAEARVADGKTNKDFLRLNLKAAQANTASIFAHISRNAESPSGWALQNVSDFCMHEEVEDWAAEVSKHLV